MEYFPVVKCNNSCPWASYSYRKETTIPKTHLPHTSSHAYTVNLEKGGVDVSFALILLFPFSSYSLAFIALVSPFSLYLTFEPIFHCIMNISTLILTRVVFSSLPFASQRVTLCVCEEKKALGKVEVCSHSCRRHLNDSTQKHLYWHQDFWCKPLVMIMESRISQY